MAKLFVALGFDTEGMYYGGLAADRKDAIDAARDDDVPIIDRILELEVPNSKTPHIIKKIPVTKVKVK